MSDDLWDETMVETHVSYIVETDCNRFIVIENVPVGDGGIFTGNGLERKKSQTDNRDACF